MMDVWLRDTRWRASSPVAHAKAVAKEARGTRSHLLREAVMREARFDAHPDALHESGGDPVLATWRLESARLTFEIDADVQRDFRALQQFDAACAADPALQYSSHVAQEAATVLWNLGEHERLAHDRRIFDALDSEETGYLEADLIGAAHGVDSPEWLAHVNSHLGEVWQHTPMAFAGDGADLFDRLEARSERAVTDGPLVSVIMPTHRRGREIVTAVRSILRQTWKNLELVIVDDASGPEFDARLEQVAALDSRVRLIRLDRNVGAYGARNVALGSVRGEYVTFQDDDDWSHPERIERQVLPLIGDSGLCSTISQSARVTDHMVFRYRGQRILRPNASSLMFRSADLGAVGFFDATRKAGDTEHAMRLAAMTGCTHVDIPDVLALVRLTGGSLSRTDFGVGWRHPSRSEYREAFEYFHERLATGRARVPGASGARVFPAPRRFLSAEQLKDRPTRYDVVVARDWRTVDHGGDLAATVLRCAKNSGMTVGIVHIPDPRQPGTWATPIAPELRSLIHDGVVDRLLLTDEVEVDSLLIEDPALLQVAERSRWSMDVERVVFVPVDVPVESGTPSAWSVDAVTALANEDVGTARVEWIGGDDASRRTRLMASAQIGPVRDGEGRAGRLTPPALRPGGLVVGTVGGLPDVEPAVESSALDVRVLMDPKDEQPTDGAFSTSLVYRRGDIGFRVFINQLDFYLLGDPKASGIASRATAVRAAALGRVVIADPECEPDLGAAALYRPRDQVAGAIAELAANRGAYDEQVGRAQTYLASASDDVAVLALLASTEETWRVGQS
ncbi:glycosyltransferase family 2 protein [Demequina sp. SO4-13]|uniref:glycosyltransferase family 2 protein n=1 Tax=Demequina sp. SO4-13 TaxID=3401027 RepID=UPI003AF7CC3C